MDIIDVTSEEIRVQRKKYMVTHYYFKLAEENNENIKEFETS